MTRSHYVRIAFYMIVSQWWSKILPVICKQTDFYCLLIKQRYSALMTQQSAPIAGRTIWVLWRKTQAGSALLGCCPLIRIDLGRCPSPAWSTGPASPARPPGPSLPAWCPNPLTEQQFVCLPYGECVNFLPTKNPLRRGIFNPSTLI